jgi:hypothetical protein
MDSEYFLDAEFFFHAKTNDVPNPFQKTINLDRGAEIHGLVTFEQILCIEWEKLTVTNHAAKIVGFRTLSNDA